MIFELKKEDLKFLNMSKEEFEAYLKKNYPKFFLYLLDEENHMPICFGLQIEKGWYHIIDDLCKQLKVIEDKFGMVCVFCQIKQKYASGRFYYEIDDSNCVDKKNIDIIRKMIENLVDYYENYSSYVCDFLGTKIYGEKVCCGHYYYPNGLEGFVKKINTHSFYNQERKNEMIKEAEDYIESKSLIKEINHVFIGKNNEELKKILKELKTEGEKKS